MSLEPFELLIQLGKVQMKIETICTELTIASKKNQITIYHQKHQEFKNALIEFHDLLAMGESYPEEKVTKEFSQQFLAYSNYISFIHVKIPKPPKPIKQNETLLQQDEKQPLLEEEENQEKVLDLQCQEIIEMHEKDTQEILNIVNKMKELQEAFIRLHSLTEIQQVQIDNICTNIEVAEEHIEEATEDVVKAEQYQKSSSKKLRTILSICGGFASGTGRRQQDDI